MAFWPRRWETLQRPGGLANFLPIMNTPLVLGSQKEDLPGIVLVTGWYEAMVLWGFTVWGIPG